ncbi:MAG TPA: acetylxylan esterase [Chloroflexota bacterium]|nr:acetylxylan esterase [Chloroflexota bacterium]
MREMLAEHLYRLFRELSEANEARRAGIDTSQAWHAERERLLAAYRRMLGRFPDPAPLRPRVTGRLERERYAIEKLIYETQPGLLVTANAYVPKGRAWPVPGVLVPCGHSANGKAAETYQRVCAGLASKGYFVLIYDPLGQGERQLYWDDTAQASRLGSNTTQHSYAGNQCLLLGLNLAQYMVWDSLRSIDYLLSRPEVDPQRIAIAGNSGGGTNVAYTAPLDERIRVAVPCCYITTLTWRRRSWTTGDAEQNLSGQLAQGLDHADFLALVAPRPLLVGSARYDYFPLPGAQESVATARRVYETLGVAERVAHAVAEAPHGYSIQLRRATYAWLNRWLGDEAAGDDEPQTPVELDADLQCTPHGQVALLGSEDVFTLNRKRLAAPVPPRTMSVADAVREKTRYESPAARPPARPAQSYLFRHEGVRRAERVTLWPEPDLAVPGMVYTWRAHAGAKRAVLWVDAAGQETLGARPAFREALSALLPQGWLLMTIDVRGTGETAPLSTGRESEGHTARVMGAEAFLTYESFVVGRPLLGMRLRDVACAVDYLRAREDVERAAGVTLVGWGAGGLIALHLAGLEPEVCAVATVDTLASYRSLVEHEHYAHHVGAMVPGIVRGPDSPDGYDVDDLLGLIAPRPVLQLRPADHLDRPLSSETDGQVGERLLAWLRRLAPA